MPTESELLAALADAEDAFATHTEALRQLRYKRDSQLKAWQKAVDDQQAATQALQASKREQHTDEASLADSEKRKHRATEALNMGLGDPSVAEHQLEHAVERIDALETAMLERMEQIEAQSTALEHATAALAEAQALEDAAKIAFDEAATSLRTLRSEAFEAAKSAIDALPHDLKNAIQVVQKARERATARLEGRLCLSCRRTAPTQVAGNVLAGRGLHACESCGRYLVPVAPKA